MSYVKQGQEITETLLSRVRPDRNDLRIENHYFPSLRKEFRKNRIAKDVLDGTQRREIRQPEF